MPEQYEVARVAEYLRDSGIESQTVKAVRFVNGGERMLKNSSIEEMQALLLGQPLLSIDTKAKFTYLQFPNGTWEWHYRFTGIPHIEGRAYEDELYTLFSLPIQDVSKRYRRMELVFEQDVLFYVDTRCLSQFVFYLQQRPDETTSYLRIAPDLTQFAPESYRCFHGRVRNSRRFIKQYLLDQRAAPSGIGNYLACEILAEARLFPFLAVRDLTAAHYDALIEAIEVVKFECLKSAKYDWFWVFNRSHCRRCGLAVIKVKRPRGSQMTHYCLGCQSGGGL